MQVEDHVEAVDRSPWEEEDDAHADQDAEDRDDYDHEDHDDGDGDGNLLVGSPPPRHFPRQPMWWEARQWGAA